MRWRGLEPPRGINPTRPSTLRVYQFRHQRATAHCSHAFRSSAAHLRYAPVRELCEQAVAAALGAGASYADARVVVRARRWSNEERPRRAARRPESEGIGVRVLVGGAWGFACDRRLDRGGARAAAGRAVAFARASAGRPPAGSWRRSSRRAGEYRTPVERDPFEVSLAREGRRSACARRRRSRSPDVEGHAALRSARSASSKVFVSSEGARLEQEIVECGGGIDAIAVARRASCRSRSYPSAPRRLERAGRLGVRRVARARARGAARRRAGRRAPPRRPVPAGRDDRRHRRRADGAAGARVGRPPDRARPRLRHRGRLRGHELPQAGRPRLAALRLRAHERHRRRDDAAAGSAPSASTTRACRAGREPIVSEGVLERLPHLARDGGADRQRRGGSMRADGWSRMPLVRMTNLHLEPGEGSLEELLAGVDDGVFLQTNKSWSIDDKRLNFQFGTQIAWEIKDGKLGRMLRDATYTGVTPVFWGSLDARRRARGVAAVRADELRQGPARPARARLARRLAGPVPQRPGRRARRERARARRAGAARRRGRRGARRSCRASAPGSRASPARRCTSRR